MTGIRVRQPELWGQARRSGGGEVDIYIDKGDSKDGGRPGKDGEHVVVCSVAVCVMFGVPSSESKQLVTSWRTCCVPGGKATRMPEYVSRISGLPAGASFHLCWPFPLFSSIFHLLLSPG